MVISGTTLACWNYYICDLYSPSLLSKPRCSEASYCSVTGDPDLAAQSLNVWKWPFFQRWENILIPVPYSLSCKLPVSVSLLAFSLFTTEHKILLTISPPPKLTLQYFGSILACTGLSCLEPGIRAQMRSLMYSSGVVSCWRWFRRAPRSVPVQELCSPSWEPGWGSSAGLLMVRSAQLEHCCVSSRKLLLCLGSCQCY